MHSCLCLQCYITCTVHPWIDGCKVWCLSSSCSSAVEYYQLKLGILDSISDNCKLFPFPHSPSWINLFSLSPPVSNESNVSLNSGVFFKRGSSPLWNYCWPLFSIGGRQTEMVELTRQAGLIPNELHDLRNNRLKSWIEVASVKGI